MRILHVPQRYHPAVGGVETYVRSVARQQVERGHEVEILTSAEAGRPAEDTVDGLAVHRLPVNTFRGHWLFPPWLRMPGLADAIVRLKPDLVHAHGYGFDTTEGAAEAQRRAGIPFVMTAHGFHPPPNAIEATTRWLYDRRGGARTTRAAKVCIAVAQHEVRDYERLGVPRARIEVVPNGLPPSAFERGDGARFRKEHGLSGPVVLFLARLAPNKGAVELAQASRLVPGATFVFCGPDNGAEPRIREAAGPNARFLGAVPDTRDALAAADVYCLPSHYEGHSMVLSEAMAQGRAIVTSSAPGNVEVIGDAGVVAPVRDARALADAIARLLADQAERARLSAAARERARGFLWERVLTKLDAVYARAVA